MIALEGFKRISYPENCGSLPNRGDGYVYVFCYSGVPFYVGQTRRMRERMEDYVGRAFAACTDFRVGSAASYLSGLGFEISVHYRNAVDPKLEEKALIRDFVLAGYRLLNSLPAFDYSASRADAELWNVHKFCDMLIENQAAAQTARR